MDLLWFRLIHLNQITLGLTPQQFNLLHLSLSSASSSANAFSVQASQDGLKPRGWPAHAFLPLQDGPPPLTASSATTRVHRGLSITIATGRQSYLQRRTSPVSYPLTYLSVQIGGSGTVQYLHRYVIRTNYLPTLHHLGLKF